MEDGEQVRAVFRFDAAQPGDLQFREGEIITVLEKNANGWWFGKTLDGREGIFPFNRVEKLLFTPPQSPPRPTFRNVPVESANNHRVIDIDVTPASKNDKKGYSFFQVVVQVSAGSKSIKTLSAKKTMRHFRKLESAIRKLDLGFQKKLPPIWADKVPMTKLSKNNMAAQLEKYLFGASSEILMALVVHWVDERFNYNIQPDQMSKVRKALGNARVRAIPRDRMPDIARTLYPWNQRDDMEITLDEGEFIAVLEEVTQYEGWWMGQKSSGKRGLFPYNYVERLSPEEVESLFSERATMTSKPKNNTRLTLSSTGARKRRLIQKYVIADTETFDTLVSDGVALESDGKLVRQSRKSLCPVPGDLVSLTYNAYIWEPQKQQLLEFASSDKLHDAKEEESGPLQFVIGKAETIEGLEIAVQMMIKGQRVRAIIHPRKAYGEVGSPPIIPMNAYLVYDLSLKSVGDETVKVSFDKKGASLSARIVGIGKARVAKRPSRTSLELVKSFNPNNKKSLAIAQGNRPDRPSRDNKPQFAMQRTASNGNMHVSGQHMRTNGSNTAKYKKAMTFQQLKDILKKGQNEQYKLETDALEDYLTDEAFKEALGVDRITFILMPWYKQKELKSKAGLKVRPRN